MDAQYSGISYYTLNLLQNIFKIDKENEYKLFYNSFKKLDLEKFFLEKLYPNVEIVKTSYPNKLFNYVLQKSFKYPKIDKILGGVDVFFAPHLNFFSISPNCKKVITIHDLSFVVSRDFFSLRKNIWHKMLGVKKILQEFDEIIAVSQNTKNDIIEFFNIPEEKVKVVYSGVDEKYKKLDLGLDVFEKVKTKYRLPAKFILYLGNIEPRKNIESIIFAYDRFCEKNLNNDLELVIAGGTGWKNKSIFQILNKIKNNDKIHFIGYVDELDKVFLYNLSDIFIYVSFYEGFGFPPIEAMFCGVPTIVANNSSLPEIVTTNSLMINADNITEIEQAITLLNSDYKLKENLIKKGLINNKYNWETTARETLNIILNLK